MKFSSTQNAMLYVLELMESYCCRLLKMGEKKRLEASPTCLEETKND
jgi:hypothetical protein